MIAFTKAWHVLQEFGATGDAAVIFENASRHATIARNGLEVRCSAGAGSLALSADVAALPADWRGGCHALLLPLYKAGLLAGAGGSGTITVDPATDSIAYRSSFPLDGGDAEEFAAFFDNFAATAGGLRKTCRESSAYVREELGKTA